MLTLFGTAAVTVLFLAYWLEHRSTWLVIAFALGTGLTAVYGFLAEAYPIAGVETLWTVVALSRFLVCKNKEARYAV